MTDVFIVFFFLKENEFSYFPFLLELDITLLLFCVLFSLTWLSKIPCFTSFG